MNEKIFRQNTDFPEEMNNIDDNGQICRMVTMNAGISIKSDKECNRMLFIEAGMTNKSTGRQTVECL
jgi:hypothetical protein